MNRFHVTDYFLTVHARPVISETETAVDFIQRETASPREESTYLQPGRRSETLTGPALTVTLPKEKALKLLLQSKRQSIAFVEPINGRKGGLCVWEDSLRKGSSEGIVFGVGLDYLRKWGWNWPDSMCQLNYLLQFPYGLGQRYWASVYYHIIHLFNDFVTTNSITGATGF